MNKKPWQSKTLWMNLIGGALALFYPPANEFLQAHADLVVLAFTVINLVLRVVTKGAIAIE